jgi:hypothetical protein
VGRQTREGSFTSRKGVYSFWVVEGIPAVEAFCLFEGVAGKEVDHGEPPSGHNCLEHDGVKSPDRNLLEKRR